MARYQIDLGDRTVGVNRRYEDVLDRVRELKEARDQTLPSMMRTAMMLDGGQRAVQAMLGKDDDKSMRDMPISNYMRDASEAFASRLGAIPDLRVDPPTTGRLSDESDRKQKAAEKRARIVAAYDDDNLGGLAEQLPMLARWVPGASYAVFTIDPVEINGSPYPKATLHNPLNTMLGQWTSIAPPEDCGFVRKVPIRELKRTYPHHADKFDTNNQSRVSGGVLLDGRQRDGLGVEVVSYYDRNGTWWVVPDYGLLLDFAPNPLASAPAFVALTKFSYNRLRGEYDDMIGPMVSMARLKILSEVAVRKDVAQPTNLFTGAGGPLSGNYQQGFNATNIFDVNARVEIPNGTIQHQAWQQLDRLERELRIEGVSPVQDSGESPMSFVTGRGLNALSERVERMVSEYQRVFKAGLQRKDARQLEYDEKAWPNVSKPMAGVRQGAMFEETYTPRTHIKGAYATRREYGAMASVDEAVRLNGLMLMDQAEWVSKKWVRTQLDELGIPESQMEAQIRAENAEAALEQWILAHASDPQSPEHLRALRMLRNRMPAGASRDDLDEMVTSAEEAAQEREQAAAAMQQPQQQPSEEDVIAALGGGGPGGGGPTTLSRITQRGSPEGGTQVIAGGQQ